MQLFYLQKSHIKGKCQDEHCTETLHLMYFVKTKESFQFLLLI